jgi:hypothetical protein
MRSALTARSLVRWAAVVAVNLAVAAATLAAADAYLRSRGHEPYLRTFPGLPYESGRVAWARADPRLGWTIEPSFLPGQINPQGFRDTQDFERSPKQAGTTRVMLLGDSFVVGANLPPVQTLPALLESRLGDAHDVFSLAVPGWGIDQMYLAYERYKSVLRPDIVVLAFIDDDIRRVLEAYRSAERLTKPVLTVVDGRVARLEAVSHGRQRMNRMLGRSVLVSLVAREFQLATEASDLAEAIFAAIAADMRGAGGRTIVMRIPTRDDGDGINQLRRSLRGFELRFAGTAVTYLDATSETAGVAWSPDLYVEDGHLNAAGTERLANVLLGRITTSN